LEVLDRDPSFRNCADRDGPSFPAGCFAALPLIDKNGPVGMCLNPSGHPVPGSFQFALYADSTEVAAAFLRYFRERPEAT
jgi:hypothetical protein